MVVADAVASRRRTSYATTDNQQIYGKDGSGAIVYGVVIEAGEGYRRGSAAWMGARLSINIPSLRARNAPDTALSDFVLVDSLGRGTFGKVYVVNHRGTGSRFAMKVLSKRRLVRKLMVTNVLGELEILKDLSHPFISTLWFTFHDEHYLYMISEYLSGGDLRYHLNQRGRFSESRAKLYLCEMTLALEYLRIKSIAHLDIKPENILLDTEGHTRLADFNLAVQLRNSEDRIYSFTGTRTYMAAEILKTSVGLARGYDCSVDWWSLGRVYQRYTSLHEEIDEF